MQQLELKFSHDELKELYEQEAALNFSKTKFFRLFLMIYVRHSMVY
jgi:hypothetical protein